MRLKILALAVLVIGFAQCSFGATITSGFFDIAGTIFVTTPEAGGVITPAGDCPANTSCIFWQDSAGTTDNVVDIAQSGLPNGDIPLAISGNDAATIAPLENPPEGVGTPLTPQTFITFNNGGISTALLLTYIDPGFYPSTGCSASPAAPGQICTLLGSLFNFVNNPPAPGQATATWVFEGITDTPNIIWTGNFTSQFPNATPFQTVFEELAANGYVSNTFSGTISLTLNTPEPGTLGLMMIGGGMLGLASLLRRANRKSK